MKASFVDLSSYHNVNAVLSFRREHFKYYFVLDKFQIRFWKATNIHIHEEWLFCSSLSLKQLSYYTVMTKHPQRMKGFLCYQYRKLSQLF